MQEPYEKPMWSADAHGYGSTSSLFATMAVILGGLGVIAAMILFFIALSHIGDGGFGGMIGAITIAFQSVMLIVFGSMMRLQSKVLLAVFEMSLGEFRQQINQADTDTQD